MRLLRTVLAIIVGGIMLPKAYGVTPSADPSAPYPPMQLVIQKVMQTSADENAEYHIFNQHYSYTRDKVTQFFNSGGKVTERDEKQSTNCPNPVGTAPKLNPAVPHVAPSGKQASPAEGPNIHGVALGKKEDLLNADLLKRFTLTMVGREMINGRPALVIDFKPVSSSLPVFNIKDRVINSVAGRVWVDEGDFTLEKVDLHLTQKLTLVGGLIGSVSKFTLSFDRERTPDGYWFTHNLDWHIEAHEATVPRVVDHHEEVSNLQKRF